LHGSKQNIAPGFLIERWNGSMRRHLWHDNARNHEINLIRFGSKKFYCDRDGGCDDCNQEDQIGVIAKETHA